MFANVVAAKLFDSNATFYQRSFLLKKTPTRQQTSPIQPLSHERKFHSFRHETPPRPRIAHAHPSRVRNVLSDLA